MSFQPKKDDENGFRRQKNEFPGSKRRRDKKRISCPKLVIRKNVSR
ncbi:hypothetical protein [Caldibacillus sp. 210928-DFI.2.22]|nr:hypothetical protein [Caldibacillus sp. 210928-DFI.2.22]